MRNPPWIKDELILALDLYFRNLPQIPNPTHDEVHKLSAMLKKMNTAMASQSPNYRSPESVAMKLMNFCSIDPDYAGKGLSAVGKRDKEVWNEYSSKRTELSNIASAIREYSQLSNYELEPDDTMEAPEGRILTRVHLVRERNKALVNKRKNIALQESGCLKCEVCGFDFEDVYGTVGSGYIECHHTTPLHSIEPGSKTHVNDLALLCANCHRIIHSHKPWLTIDELKKAIKKSRQNTLS